MEGLLVIALGLGMLWSAKVNAEDASAMNEFSRRREAERGYPRWLLAVLFPKFLTSRRFNARLNYGLSALVIVAGILTLAGVLP